MCAHMSMSVDGIIEIVKIFRKIWNEIWFREKNAVDLDQVVYSVICQTASNKTYP